MILDFHNNSISTAAAAAAATTTSSSSTINHHFFQVFDALAANETGRYHAIVVSGLSAAANILILCLHYLDSSLGEVVKYFQNNNFLVRLQSTLRTLFRPGSLFECSIIVFFNLWWIIAIAIITTIRGPAGDGKGQFNLYFSTWLCFITYFSMFELWLIEADHGSIFQGIASWPYRAPGWIMIFTCTLANLISLLDLYNRHGDMKDVAPHIWEKYHSIDLGQWIWLMFVCSISFTAALGFSLVELFRRGEAEALGNISREGVNLNWRGFV